jgi:hypothetical protein
MAITTADGIVAGFLAGGAPIFVNKGVTASTVAMRMYSTWRTNGSPSPGTTSAGAVYDSTSNMVEGQIPFRYPSNGKCYLGRALLTGSVTAQSTFLVDRIFSANITATSVALQPITAVALPPRDDNGASDGVGYLVGAEVHTAMGAATPTISVGYTNSDGVAGRFGSNVHPTASGAAIGAFYPISLQGADKGVRQLDSVQLSASWLSGGVALVVYRILASLPIGAIGGPSEINPITGDMPELYQGTVPFLLHINLTGGTSNVEGVIQYLHG